MPPVPPPHPPNPCTNLLVGQFSGANACAEMVYGGDTEPAEVCSKRAQYFIDESAWASWAMGQVWAPPAPFTNETYIYELCGASCTIVGHFAGSCAPGLPPSTPSPPAMPDLFPYKISVRFRASGAVEDFDVETRDLILSVLSGAAGVTPTPEGASLTVSPASVMIVAVIPFATAETRQSAFASLANAASTATALSALFAAAGVSVVVESLPSITQNEVSLGGDGGAPDAIDVSSELATVGGVAGNETSAPDADIEAVSTTSATVITLTVITSVTATVTTSVAATITTSVVATSVATTTTVGGVAGAATGGIGSASSTSVFSAAGGGGGSSVGTLGPALMPLILGVQRFASYGGLAGENTELQQAGKGVQWLKGRVRILSRERPSGEPAGRRRLVSEASSGSGEALGDEDFADPLLDFLDQLVLLAIVISSLVVLQYALVLLWRHGLGGNSGEVAAAPQRPPTWFRRGPGKEVAAKSATMKTVNVTSASSHADATHAAEPSASPPPSPPEPVPPTETTASPARRPRLCALSCRRRTTPSFVPFPSALVFPNLITVALMIMLTGTVEAAVHLLGSVHLNAAAGIGASCTGLGCSWPAIVVLVCVAGYMAWFLYMVLTLYKHHAPILWEDADQPVHHTEVEDPVLRVMVRFGLQRACCRFRTVVDRARGGFELTDDDIVEPARTQRLLARPFALQHDNPSDRFASMSLNLVGRSRGNSLPGITYDWVELFVQLAIAAALGMGPSIVAVHGVGSGPATAQLVLVLVLQALLAVWLLAAGPGADRFECNMTAMQFAIEAVLTVCVLADPTGDTLRLTPLVLGLSAMLLPVGLALYDGVVVSTIKRLRREEKLTCWTFTIALMVTFSAVPNALAYILGFDISNTADVASSSIEEAAGGLEAGRDERASIKERRSTQRTSAASIEGSVGSNEASIVVSVDAT